MTVMEEYKKEIEQLTFKLDRVSFGECYPEVFELVMEASKKLKEMVEIVENVGVANGTMAKALQIMMKE